MNSEKENQVMQYCDSLYNELSRMKETLDGFIGRIDSIRGGDREMLRTHKDHLGEIVRTIDWKLEILTRVCPYEWEGSTKDAQRVVSVPCDDPGSSDPMAGGYLGG